MFKILVLGLLILLSGCAGDNTQKWRGGIAWTGMVDQQNLDAGNHWAIDNDADIYIATPKQTLLDDQFHDELSEVFRRYYPKALTSGERETLQQSFKSAQYAGMDYLVYPILRKRIARKGFDLVTSKEIKIEELRRPVLEMDILIYSTNTEEIVDHLQIVTKGSIFSPDETALIWPPLNDYLKKLSQYSAIGS